VEIAGSSLSRLHPTNHASYPRGRRRQRAARGEFMSMTGGGGGQRVGRSGWLFGHQVIREALNAQHPASVHSYRHELEESVVQ